MGTLSNNYARRILGGVKRFGSGLTLVGEGTSGAAVRAIILPGVVQVGVPDSGAHTSTSTGTTTAPSFADGVYVVGAVSDISAVVMASAAAVGDGCGIVSAVSSAITSSSTVYNTLYLLQSGLSTENVPIRGQTFSLDGATWTVRSVEAYYMQGQRIALLSSATSPIT